MTRSKTKFLHSFLLGRTECVVTRELKNRTARILEESEQLLLIPVRENTETLSQQNPFLSLFIITEYRRPTKIWEKTMSRKFFLSDFKELQNPKFVTDLPYGFGLDYLTR